jgi:hypothetical protein
MSPLKRKSNTSKKKWMSEDIYITHTQKKKATPSYNAAYESRDQRGIHTHIKRVMGE